MEILLGLVLSSFFLSAVLVVPFINLLYKLKFRRTWEKEHGKQEGVLYDQLTEMKIGTPVGGGILVIFVTVLLSLSIPILLHVDTGYRMIALLLAMIGFGILGLYDDINKFFKFKQQGVWGMRMRWKFVIQWTLAIIIAFILYYKLGYNSVYIYGLGNLQLGEGYLAFASFVIVAFCNAFNITDGLDGLAGGLLVICLLGFLVIASTIVDPTLQIFLGLLDWIDVSFSVF